MDKIALQAAVELAAQIAITPEALIDGKLAKQTIIALHEALAKSRCYMRAQLEGRETFCLSSDDSLAPFAIEYWASAAEDQGAAPDKIGDAREMAARWKNNPNASLPD